MHESNAIVMDNGTGYTKLGYSGNNKPQLMIPTVILNRTSRRSASDEYDFFIGDEALSASGKADVARTLSHPIRHGQVESWDLMESYWQHCFFRYLRCDPEQHRVLLTEPPLNSPENREATAEIMFETFNVPALHIAVQAVLALAASWLDPSAKDSSNVDKKSSGSISKTSPLTGTVVDSGDGVTHIIPVVDGYAISSAIKHVPMAGREITMYLQQLLRDRPDVLRFEDSLNAASRLDTMEMSKNIKANLILLVQELLWLIDLSEGQYNNPEKKLQVPIF